MAFGKESFPLWERTATLVVTEPGRLETARRAVERVITDIDRACSPRRVDSDLALVAAAAGRPARAGATFHAVLWTALHAAEITEGRVDPISGGDGADWRSVRVDEPAGTVTLPPGAALDFGAIAQAFAADRAAELAAGESRCGVLFALGGDVAVAGPVPPAGWPVRVGDNHHCERHGRLSGQDVTLRMAGGLATSRLEVRTRTLPGGQIVTHILDPRSSRAVHGPWRTISVAAGSCVEAGTVSSAAMKRGTDAPDWLASLGLPARMVHFDGWATTVGGWPADADRPIVDVAG
ncbi:FAD:protein FMN transferase [Actinomadura scrupuli]|uniref:FAD:protein FMN transferase n=1 Tax=Actinomadura scrupuli TaxID=559629 RepID=UPI003D995D01